MKNICFVLLFLVNVTSGYAQQWKSNLNEALREAGVAGKEVLLFFSIPEACETCVKLEENVFKSNEFKSYSGENYILVKQDFQSAKSGENIEENLLIVEKYNKDGFFPLVVIIGKDGKALGNIGIYKDETPAEYVAKLRTIEKNH